MYFWKGQQVSATAKVPPVRGFYSFIFSFYIAILISAAFTIPLLFGNLMDYQINTPFPPYNSLYIFTASFHSGLDVVHVVVFHNYFGTNFIVGLY